MGQRPGGKQPIAIKVYLVFERMNLARDGYVNSRVIATRLTRHAAEAIVDTTPGTWIEKHVAIK